MILPLSSGLSQNSQVLLLVLLLLTIVCKNVSAELHLTHHSLPPMLMSNLIGFGGRQKKPTKLRLLTTSIALLISQLLYSKLKRTELRFPLPPSSGITQLSSQLSFWKQTGVLQQERDDAHET